MRRHVALILMVFGLLCVPILAGAQEGTTRVAFVDVDRVTARANFVRDLLAGIEEEVNEKRAGIEAKRAEYERLREEMRRKESAASNDEVEKMARESRRLRLEMEEEEYTLNRMLRANEKEKMLPAFERIVKTAGDVAEEAGIDLVVSSEVVLYATEKIDLTDQVVEKLNNEYEKSGESGGRMPAISTD